MSEFKFEKLDYEIPNFGQFLFFNFKKNIILIFFNIII